MNVSVNHALFMAIHNRFYDDIEAIVSDPANANLARDFIYIALDTYDENVIRPFLKVSSLEEHMKRAITNRDQRMIDILKRIGLDTPQPLGDPDMVCSVEVLDCRNPGNRERLEELKILEKQQDLYFGFTVLDNGCSDNVLYYVATSHTSQGEIVCGSVMVKVDFNEKYGMDTWKIVSFSTQTPFNPYMRNKRVGCMLINMIIDDARRNGAWGVIISNPYDSAVSFYEKHGFKMTKSADNEMVHIFEEYFQYIKDIEKRERKARRETIGKTSRRRRVPE